MVRVMNNYGQETCYKFAVLSCNTKKNMPKVTECKEISTERERLMTEKQNDNDLEFYHNHSNFLTLS